MARLGPVRLGLALAIVFTANIHRATSDDKCRTGCRGITPRDFKFAEGTTYKYNYEGTIDVTLSSAEGQQSTTKVRATVLLTQQPQCDQIIRLQNFQILGADAKKYTNIEGIDKPIRINFHDGHVEDVICTDPSDTQNSLNLKRAVASMLQAVPKHSTEIDVFGLCPTDFSTHKEGNVLIIKKARNLNKCSYRENIKQDFMATAFDTNSEIKSSPFLQGDFKSEQRIKNGILEHVSVTESYLYVPFSVGNSGAKATVQSKLTLAGTSKENPKVPLAKPRSLIFENPHPIRSEKTNVNSILGTLKDMVNTIDLTVKQNTANKFYNLVRIIRVANKNDLLAVYNQVRAGAGFTDKVAAKKAFLDAIFRAGSGDSIDVAMELYKNKELDDLESKLFFLGITFVKHVGENSLKTAANLLEIENLPREAYLGVGTLAGRYCREHPCANVDQVNVLMNAFVAKLNVEITNRDVENVVISILKSIKNARHVNDALAQKITQLALDKSAPIRVRVAALEAYASDSCRDKFRDSALNIMKDIQLDSELRIKAYLAAAECPTGKTANVVKTLLENEPSYQVGGFIVSHLRTLRTSVNPDKAIAKAQLGQIIVTKKYPFDLRKFSFNAEISNTFDTLGLMSSTEANVIYSQKSFAPRSVSLNLTAQVFGHTFNFLEIDARQENLDRLAERYLGPMGVLGKMSPFGMYNKAQDSAKNFRTKIEEHIPAIKAKRDVSKSHIDYITNQLTDKQNELNKDLDLDLSVKLFGSEALFLSLNDDVKQFSPETIIDRIFDVIEKQTHRIAHMDEIIRSNLVFLESEVSYPTSLGFPLRLSVEGTSTVQIKAATSFEDDVQKLKISLIPSANVELTSRFVLDAALIEGGLKVTGNLYSATGGSIDLLSDRNGHTEYKITLPLEKQQLVTATHDLVFETRELGGSEINHPIKMTQNKDFSVCLDQLSPVIGVTFCAEINQPNVAAQKGVLLPYPLNGNSKFSIYIEKNDLGYYYYRKQDHGLKGGPKRGLETSLGAVDQKGDPKVSLDLQLFVRPDMFVLVTLKSPMKSATTEMRIISTGQEKSILAKFAVDMMVYYGKIGVSVSGNGRRAIYKPIIEYQAGMESTKKPPVYAEGQIIVEEAGSVKKFILDDVKIISPNHKPIVFSGNVALESASVTADIALTDGAQKGSLKGLIKYDNDLKVNIELQNSINPQANFNLKCEIKKGAHDLEHNFQLIHGADLSSKRNIFKMTNVLIQENDGERYKIGTKNHVSYPALEFETTFDLITTQNSLEYDVDFAYKKIKFGSELEAKVNDKVVGNYDVDFELHAFENKLDVEMKREIIGHKSKIDNKVALNDKSIRLDGSVNHYVDNNKFDLGTNVNLKMTDKPDVNIVSKLSYNPVDVDTLLKVTSGGNTLIDTFFKGNKAGNANGSVKLNIKDVVKANGQLKAVKGAGNANILFEVPKMQRKIKSDATFTVKDPTYNFDVTLFTDFEKDNSKKYHVSTTNQIKPDSLDSKNVIEILGKTTTANFKGGYTGTFQDGTQNFNFDVTLPDEHYFAGKMNREHLVGKTFTAFLNLEHRGSKNEQGRKLTYKGEIKDTKLDDKYDATFSLAIDNNGASCNGDLKLKGWKKNGKNVLDWNAKAYGNVLKESIEANAYAELSDDESDYKIDVKHGKDTSLKVKGKYDIKEVDKNKPSTGELSIEIKTPIEALSSIKFDSDGSILLPSDKQQNCQLKGSSLLLVENGATKEKTVNFKTSYETTITDHTGRIKWKLELQNLDPIAFTLNYDEEKLKGFKLHGDASLQYKADKSIKGDLTYAHPGQGEHSVDLKLETPEEKVKNIRLQINGKSTNDDKTRSGEIVLTLNGKVYTLNNDVDLSEHHPSLSFVLKKPDGKIDKLITKITKLGERSIAGETIIWYSPSDFTFEGSVDIDAENMDNFLLKFNAHSPALKIEKFEMHANTKEAKGNKKIIFSAKSNNKNILSGGTTYKTREDGGKFVLEGSGNFKYKDESKSGNFKFSKQTLTTEKNQEEGIEITFDAALGNKAIDAEFKATNKQFRILNSYCEEKKQCAHIEVDSKTSINEVDQFSNVWEVTMDLRKLGLSHEFGLKSVTNRKDFFLDHTFEVHFQNRDHKYEYSVYVHPKKAGLSFTTPKRLLSIEADFTTSHTGTVQTIDGEVLIYLNKKTEPNKKTSISLTMTSDEKPQEYFKYNSEFKLTHPALRKPLTTTYKSFIGVKNLKVEADLVIDIFQNTDDKILISTKADGEMHDYAANTKSLLIVDIQPLRYKLTAEEKIDFDFFKTHSLGYDSSVIFDLNGRKRNSEYKYYVNPKSAGILLQLQNSVILDVNSHLQLSKESQIIDTDITALGLQKYKSHLELKNFNTINFYLSNQAHPNDKLQINSALIPGQIADFRMDVQKSGKTLSLMHAYVKLDDADFMKSDYGINKENLKIHFYDHVNQRSQEFVKEYKNLMTKSIDDAKTDLKTLGEVAKNKHPDLKPIVVYYKDELKKLRQEITEDKTIEQLGESIVKILAAIEGTLSEIGHTISTTFDEIYKTLNAQYVKILEGIEKDIIPQLKDVFERVSAEIVKLFEQVSSVFFAVVAQITSFIDAHQAELKQLANLFSGIGHDVGRFLMKTYEQTKTIVTTEANKLYEEIIALPIYKQLKEIYEQILHGLPVPDEVIQTFKHTVDTLKDMVAIDEIKTFMDVTTNYIVKKLKQETVDDLAEIETIVTALTAALKKLFAQITSEELHPKAQQIPFATRLVATLPKLVLSKSSLVNNLFIDDVETLLYSVDFNPSSWIPPFQFYGIIVQGQHLFTFDGKHLTFPGKCNYLLAKDTVNGNFTVAGTYTNGLLTAITVSDKQDIFTIKKGGVVMLNDAAVEMPARRALTHAFHNYGTLHIASKTGVHVICSVDLTLCVVEVSGFYHGQLKGLLGNANHEGYDDYTLPNGKIVTAESEFGNAYKMQNNCPGVKTVDHHTHHHVESCNKLFDEDSEMALCYKFLNPANFRQACDHGVAAGIPDTEAAIARGYVAACNMKYIPINTPSKFIKCENSEQPMSLGDTFSVKTPQKAADIVIAVDVVKSNEPIYKEMVVNMAQSLNQELGARGIKDVQFHVITYGGDFQEYPSHITTNGGKMSFKGKMPNLKFSEASDDELDIDTGIKLLDFGLSLLNNWKHDIDLALGNTPQAAAFSEAMNYPYRAHALKAIIAVTGSPCEKGNLFLLQLLNAYLLHDDTITLHTITPLGDKQFKIKDEKTTKNVIGFNQYGVFTFAEAKKKPQGNTELLKELHYDEFCVDFTYKNGGNVFISNNFLTAKGNKRVFSQVVAYNIAESLTTVERGLDCKCERMNSYSGVNKCTVAYEKSKPATGRKIMRG